MAKRKKTTRRTTRRRRVGAVGGDQMSVLLGTAIGAVGGQLLKKEIEKRSATMKPMIIGAAEIAAGYFIMKQRSPMVKGVGMGMIASGAIVLGQAAGIGGVGNVFQFRTAPGVRGYSDVKNIAGGVNGVGVGYPAVKNLAGTMAGVGL